MTRSARGAAGRGLVLIGAGSTVFTPGLLRDLTSAPAFEDYTVHLVDTNGEAAETMTAIGRRLAVRRGHGVRIEAHTDRRAALPGARFVITTIAVGGAGGWRAELEIPARYGIRQTVGDSVGPDDVHAVYAGLDHLCRLLDIRSGGTDLYPRLRELVEAHAGGRDAPSSRTEGVHAAVSAGLMRTFGRHPAPGDRHVAEFFSDTCPRRAPVSWRGDCGAART
ncbi:family 4 glycosyl hydrolase [Actinoallomurus acaciae]|uniref:Alpha-galactosidase n=1 Tax=Actinoallomurus acaciae TaxID=502577 RepID=A0ABV5Y8U2_9ACTN